MWSDQSRREPKRPVPPEHGPRRPILWEHTPGAGENSFRVAKVAKPGRGRHSAREGLARRFPRNLQTMRAKNVQWELALPLRKPVGACSHGRAQAAVIRAGWWSAQPGGEENGASRAPAVHACG